MKFAGIITVLLSTCTVGAAMYENSKKRLVICREFVVLCDALKRDFMYRATPINLLIEQIVEECRLTHIKGFLQSYFASGKAAELPMSNSQNKEVLSFLHALGKSDTQTQIALVDSFCEYISKEEETLKKSHSKNAGLYLAFGAFSGVLIVLVFV
ncbi:MAG: hypothetical protein IJI47_02775 [Eubacterium sp.]|nr:hypothetical protein [Eubacterium sp.]MBR0412476.1 hypothetical protein [Eubacterium sp.]